MLARYALRNMSPGDASLASSEYFLDDATER